MTTCRVLLLSSRKSMESSAAAHAECSLVQLIGIPQEQYLTWPVWKRSKSVCVCVRMLVCVISNPVQEVQHSASSAAEVQHDSRLPPLSFLIASFLLVFQTPLFLPSFRGLTFFTPLGFLFNTSYFSSSANSLFLLLFIPHFLSFFAGCF